MTRRSRRIWALTIVATLLAIVAAAIIAWRYYLGPDRLRAMLEQRLGEAVQAKVSVGDARLEFLGDLTIANVRVTDPGSTSGQPVMELPRAHVRPAWSQLLRGRMAIEEIHLDQPVLNVELTRAFRWPFIERLRLPSGPRREAARAPDVSINDATVRLSTPEAPEMIPGVAVNHLDIVINVADGEPRRYELFAQSRDAARASVRLRADITPAARRVEGSFQLEELHLDEEMRAQLPAALRALWDDFHITGGRVRATAMFEFNGHEEKPLHYQAVAQLEGGAFRHSLLPYAFRDLHAEVRAEDESIEILSVSGRAGDVTIQGQGRGRFTPEEGLSGRVALQSRNLELTRELYNGLPEQARRIWDALNPAGLFHARIEASFDRSRRRPDVKAEIDIERFSAAPEGTPLALGEVSGALVVTRERVNVQELHGRLAGAPFHISEGFASLSADGPLALAVKVQGLKVDSPVMELVPALLRERVPEKAREALEGAAIAGEFDLDAAVARVADGGPLEISGSTRIRDGAVRHPLASGPLRGIEAEADFQDGVLNLKGFNATWRGAAVSIKPAAIPVPPKSAFSVEAQVENLVLNDELRALLPENARRGWDRYAPSGILDGSLRIHRAGGADAPMRLDATAALRDGSFRYHRFPYLVKNATARMEIKDSDLVFIRVAGRNGPAVIEVDARPEPADDEEERSIRVGIFARNGPFNEELRAALRPAMQRAWDDMSPQGVISDLRIIIHNHFRGAALERYDFTTEATVQNVRVNRGLPATLSYGRFIIERAEGRPHAGMNMSGRVHLADPAAEQQVRLRDVTAWFQWRDGEMAVEDIVANVYGGVLSGNLYKTASPDWDSRLGVFSGSLTLVDADLTEVLRDNNISGLSGRLSATSLFHAAFGGETPEFSAAGAMIVRDADIGELPGLLGVLNLFVLKSPDAAVFNELQMAYTVRQQELRAHVLNALGPILSLYGQGTVTPEGQLQFRFVPAFGPRFPGRARVPGLGRILTEIKRQLIPLTVRGDYNDPVWRINPLLPVTRLLQNIVTEVFSIRTQSTGRGEGGTIAE